MGHQPASKAIEVIDDDSVDRAFGACGKLDDLVELLTVQLAAGNSGLLEDPHHLVAVADRISLTGLLLAARLHRCASIAQSMWMKTLLDNAVLREWLANLGRRDALSHMAHLSCEFAVRMKVAGLAIASECDLPMSQEQLADATGLASAYVNRTLKQLEEEGLTYPMTPRAVTVLDWERLSAARDFSADYLHLSDNAA